ncbi:TraB/GumN family protein [Aliiglaciecola sp.]|nr:TraB/GumN family protein [Aliiglaciecola sp.]
MNNKLILFIPLLILTFAGHATSVWKVSKNSDSVYIGGTVHMLKQSDFSLPLGYEKAYQASDALYFETDIDAITSPAFAQKMMQKAMLTDGKTLKDILSKDTLTDLNAHLESRGMPSQNFQAFKPGFLSITLTVLELNRLGFNAQGVDPFFAKKAQADGKTIAWFETPDEQLEFINRLGHGIENNIVAHTLRDMNKFEDYIKQLMQAWRSGSREKLVSVGIEEMKNDYPSVYQDLLVKRNNNWMPKIKQLFDNDKTEFVLVGALHLVGDEGVLSQLENAGFTVEKLGK